MPVFIRFRLAIRRVGLLAFLTWGLLGPPAAQAQAAAELRASGREVTNDIAAQKGAGRFDAAAQQRAVDRLGKLVLGFIDLSDRTANAGGEGRERDALRGAYEAINAPLESIYDQNGATIERLTKQVMDEDGDLEAVYDTPAFKEAQVVASQSLYFLNWLHYYGARLYDGTPRKELLEKAQRGFSEFAVGDRHSDLLVESLLGRGMCHLELGNTEFAVHDLQAVTSDPQASAERKAKARLALLDGYARNGNLNEVLKLSDQMLGSGGRAEDNLVRFIRARVLFDAAKKAAGAEAARYRQQAMTTLDQLRRAGGGWEEKAAALAASSIDNPEQFAANANSPFAKWELAKLLVQKGDYKQAMPLLEGFVSSPDDALRSHQGEAHYFLGLAKFQAGQYQEAAEQLDDALKDGKAAYGADAAYMRFKSREILVAKSPSPEFGTQYEQAVRAYLSKYPDHKSAFEAQFRLGELLQAQHKCADAVQAYAKVQGDLPFEVRARFATVQCSFELLQAIDPRGSGAQRATLLKDIGVDLRAFDTQAAEYEKRGAKSDQVPLGQMRAKMAVLTAVYATLQPELGDQNAQKVLDALAGFEKTHPDQQELLPQVVRLRLTADQRLGRFGDAEAEVSAHGPLLVPAFGTAAVEELAVGFVREGARRKNKEGAGANQAAEQVASQLYQLLVTDSDGSNKSKLTLARLYENTNQLKKSADLYGEILRANGDSPAALRGLGRIAEAEKRLPDARGYWQQLIKVMRGGDVGWYEGQYEVARLTEAMGMKQESCTQLEQLKPAMPGLSDADLRKQLDVLYQRVCR
jgi:pentatricopeptide repeat protein